MEIQFPILAERDSEPHLQGKHLWLVFWGVGDHKVLYSLHDLYEVMPLLEKSPEHFLGEHESKGRRCSALMAATGPQGDLVPELRAISVFYH